MFILRRFLAFIPVALIVALIVFLMLHLSPGDPVAAIAGDSATAADIARIRAELGLDDPLPEQFVRWCMELIQGDLGRSYFLNRPVADLIADRVGPTLSLAGFTIVLTVLIAVPLGAWAAYRQGGWVDRALMGFSVLGFSIPSFVLGYCFVWLFGLKLNLLPSQGYVRYDESIEGWISHLILPSLTLCCIYVALIARVTRASVAVYDGSVRNFIILTREVFPADSGNELPSLPHSTPRLHGQPSDGLNGSYSLWHPSQKIHG